MIQVGSKKDLLECLRNDLVPSNQQVEEKGLKGYLVWLTLENVNGVDPECPFSKFDPNTKKYIGKSKAWDCYRYLYGFAANPDPASDRFDVIFNCYTYLGRFIKGKLGYYIPKNDPNQVLEKYDLIFEGHEDLVPLFDSLAEQHHSLSNFMPACLGMNAAKGYCWETFNDMPDLFFDGARDPRNPDLQKYADWINKHKDEYVLQLFGTYKSNFPSGFTSTRLDTSDEAEMESFRKAIKDALECLDKRAKMLWEINLNCHGFAV